MKFLLDENIASSRNVRTLGAYFQSTHEFVRIQDVGMAGLEDTAVFERCQSGGFDALITSDERQRGNERERAALIDANIHWLCVPLSPKPKKQLRAHRVGLLIAGVSRLDELVSVVAHAVIMHPDVLNMKHAEVLRVSEL